MWEPSNEAFSRARTAGRAGNPPVCVSKPMRPPAPSRNSVRELTLQWPGDQLFETRPTDSSWKTPIAAGKFRIHAKIANSIIDKGGSPTSLYSRHRGRIAFAPKSGQNMLNIRPKYALNHTGF